MIRLYEHKVWIFIIHFYQSMKNVFPFIFIIVVSSSITVFFMLKSSKIPQTKQTKSISSKNLKSPCNYEPIREPCSSRRDVLFLYGTSIHNGLFLALKSLRATKANCRVVLFVPSAFQPTYSFTKFTKDYDIEVINGSDMTRKGDTVPHMLRYEYEAKWIEEHIDEVDRVIHTDGYDVFFQSDPFVVLKDNSSLIFIAESIKLGQCEWNANWVIDCYNFSALEKIKNDAIICSGVILGQAKQYLRFVKYMIETPQWTSCWDDSYDQPIVNWLVYSGKLKDLGIEYKLISCDSDVLNMQWCLYGREPQLSKKEYVMSPNHRVEPALLHQYNRFPDLMKKLGQKCGIDFSKQ